MDRTISSCLVETLNNLYKKGKIAMDYIMQRDAGQWDKEQKSLLIVSIIMGYDIPALYFVKQRDENNVEKWIVIDGIQRLTTIFDFLDNKFKLSKNLDPITVGNTTYDIAGKSFKQLPEQVSEMFVNQSIDTKYLVGYTDEELEEQFYRLNNGSVFTKQQKATITLGSTLVEKMKPLTEHSFWNKVSMSKVARKHGGVMDTILRSFMLVTGYDYGGSITATKLVSFADYFMDNYTDKQLSDMVSLFDKLERIVIDINDNMHRGERTNPFLTQNNIPTIIQHLNEYQQVEGTYITEDIALDEQRYGDFLATIAEDAETSGYLDYCGTKSSSREKIEGRIEFFRNELKAFNNLDIRLYEEDMEEEKALNNSTAEEVDNNDTRTDGACYEAVTDDTVEELSVDRLVQTEYFDVSEPFGISENENDSESNEPSDNSQGQAPVTED